MVPTSPSPGGATPADPSSAAHAAQDPSAALAALAGEYWEGHLAANPLEATAIGDRRYDHLLDDNTPEGRARDRARLEAVLARARAIPEAALPAPDGLTRTALIGEVENELALLACGLEEWTVDPLGGPPVRFFNVEAYQPVRTAGEAQAMVRRWEAMGSYLDRHVEDLRRGLAAGKVAVQSTVERVVSGLDDVLGRPDAEWALLNPLRVERPDWPAAQRAAFAEDLARAVRERVRPALRRYLQFLKAEVLPRARPPERPGLAHVPGGEECYRRLIRVHTSLDLAPEALHQTGRREVARIDAELEALGARVLGTGHRAELLRRLRTDPALYFTTRDEVAAKARAALARAAAALPGWFGVLPRAGCEVARMGAHEEQHSTIQLVAQRP